MGLVAQDLHGNQVDHSAQLDLSHRLVQLVQMAQLHLDHHITG